MKKKANKKILLGNCFLLSEAREEMRKKIMLELSRPTKMRRNVFDFSGQKSWPRENKINKKRSACVDLRKIIAEKNNGKRKEDKEISIRENFFERKGEISSRNIFQQSFSDLFFRIGELFSNLFRNWSPAKVRNFSMLVAVFFGMFVMVEIQNNLGQNVSAKIREVEISVEEANENELVLGEEDVNQEIDTTFITRLLAPLPGESDDEFERRIAQMVKGYPIEKMIPEIAKKDKITAAFIVAIAKKESNWGKRVPVLNGEDCFNYWGYRGIRERMGTGGHTCFDSPKDAVDTVAKRINDLITKEKLNTPEKMVVWKCGYDCSWDSEKAIKKWISDVEMYFKKLN